MQAGEKRDRFWDPSPFRKQNMTSWPKSHPVMFPHIHTDHWSKMKTRVPSHLASLSAAVAMGKGEVINATAKQSELGLSRKVTPMPVDHKESGEHLPVLETNVAEITLQQSHGRRGPRVSHSAPLSRVSIQNLPQYRNEYNDRARMGFCYWLMEKRVSKCNGYSFGAYKTLLGLPRV